MSKNRRGGLTGNLEWGRQARKQEDAERNLNGRARREAISEQVQDFIDRWDARVGKKITCPYCDGVGDDGRGTECGFCVNGVHEIGT